MKASTVKTFTSVHTWAGLGAGMALFIAFYAGAMTVFHHELESWDSFSPSHGSPQTLAQAQQLIDLALERDPEAAEQVRLYPADTEHPEHVVRWFQRLEDGSFERHEYRLTDQGTLNTDVSSNHVADFVYRLHYSAGIPGRVGLYALGIVSMIYGLALVTGFIIFLPNFFKDLFTVRTGKNKKQFWRDTHNAIGFISLPWHMMFAWSGAVLAIGVFLLAPFQLLVFEEDIIDLVGADLGVVAPAEAAGERAPLIPIAELLSTAKAAVPGFDINQVRYLHAGDVNGTVSVFGDVDAGTLVSNATVTLSGTTGAVMNVDHPQSATVGSTLYRGLMSLHFVTFGGYMTKWIYFVFGLLGAFLFYSGNLLWVETRRKKRHQEQPANTRFLARLNSGVCIGCVAGISAALLASRGLVGLANRADLIELAYYAVFFASLIWCFTRPIAASTRDLLYVSAAFTLAIPVFDAVFINMPPWRSAMSGEWGVLTVDLLALAGAAVFWRLARAVDARAKFGDPNSVWSEEPSRASDGSDFELSPADVSVVAEPASK